MNKLALALIGAVVSATAAAQTSDSLIAGSTVFTSTVTALAPVVALVAVTAAAESNNTPSPSTAPSSTATTR